MDAEWQRAHAAAVFKAANATIKRPVLQRVADLRDYETLLASYSAMGTAGERHLAVRAAGTLPERMSVVCSARLIATLHGLRLVVIWAEDEQLRAPFEDLFELPAAAAGGGGAEPAFRLLRYDDARLFPRQLWKVIDLDRGGSRDDSGGSVLSSLQPSPSAPGPIHSSRGLP